MPALSLAILSMDFTIQLLKLTQCSATPAPRTKQTNCKQLLSFLMLYLVSNLLKIKLSG